MGVQNAQRHGVHSVLPYTEATQFRRVVDRVCYPRRECSRGLPRRIDTMMTIETDSVTRLMAGVRSGNRDAIDALLPLVHAELRRIASRHMRRERPGHTLQPTALVNEAYLKLVDQRDVAWQNRAHFLAVASRVMRRILVDHARARASAKREGAAIRVEIEAADLAGVDRDVDLLALDEALDRLAAMDPRLGEVVENRYFGGLTTRETAEAMKLSTATVEREWAAARAWLRRELHSGATT